MSAEYHGGCSCGAVRYTCRVEPQFTLLCQCRQCQRISGAGHTAQFAVDKRAVSISGETRSHSLKSDAGNQVISVFCVNCGNPVYKATSMMSETLMIHAATLDDPAQFKPQMLVNSSSAQPWDHIDPAIARK